MLLILFFCIFIFEVQSLATNSIIIEDTKKEIKEDIIKISAESNENIQNEITINSIIQGDYYKDEKQSSYLVNINIEYTLTEEIIKFFDFSILTNPNLGKLERNFKKNNLKWVINEISNNEEVHFAFKLKLKNNFNIEEKNYPIFSNIVYKYSKTGFVIENKEARSFITPNEKNITDVPEIRIINTIENNNNENKTNTEEDSSYNDNNSIYNSNEINDITKENNETKTIANNEEKNNQNETNNTIKSVSPKPLPNTGIKGVLKIVVIMMIIISIVCVYKIRKN